MTHWYGPDASHHFYVPNASKPGQSRPTTIRDARLNGWLPSTTTVLQEISKPLVNDWRVREAVKAALDTAAAQPHETREEIIRRITRESETYRDWSAEFGSSVHLAISSHLKDGEGWGGVGLLGVQDVAEGFLEWADANALVINESEVSFVAEGGWAGTLDGIGTYFGEPCLFDLKTQDFDEVRKAVHYSDVPVQLASYAIGYEVMELTRMSFVLSRTHPGLVAPKQWGENERHEAMWMKLWEYWCASHRWGEWAAKTPTLTLLQGGLNLDD